MDPRAHALQREYLLDLRTKNKLSQGDLARSVGNTSQLFSNIERGVCGVPVKSLRKLMELLNGDLEHMIKLKARDYEEQIRRKVYVP